MYSRYLSSANDQQPRQLKMGDTLSDYRAFLTQFVRNYRTTGAIAPSGRALATALCRHVGRRAEGQRILEAGPGTGAVTAGIIERMGRHDQLWMIETNPSFVDCLRRAFQERPNFCAVADRCHLVEGRLQDLGTEGEFDLIVSGLPLNNCAPGEVRLILNACEGLLKPGGILSFFEYALVRSAKMMVSSFEERRRLRDVGDILEQALAEHELARELVLPNVPPAYVHHLGFGGGPASS